VEIDEGCDESKPRCVLTDDGTASPVLGQAGARCLERPSMVGATSLPNGDGVFHACVTLQDGSFHFIDPDMACEIDTVRISINQVGPQECEQGPVGADGLDGADGATDPEGPQGPEGHWNHNRDSLSSFAQQRYTEAT
jgi:hypothetical protein